MTFLTLPGPAVLVVWIARFDFAEAGRADENPVTVFLDANPVENVVGFIATTARLGPDSFDLRQCRYPR